MPEETQKFSRVVGAIYQAALDVASWDDALVKFVEAYSPPYWDVAFLVWEQAPQVGAQFVAAANVSPSARGLYATHFAGLHPWSRKIAAQPIGRVVDTDDICPRKELFESELYKHFLSTWAIVRALAVVLDRDGDRRLAFLVSGPDGQDIEGLRRGARLAAPHLQRAVRISRRIAQADLRAAGAEASLALSTAGVVSLGANLSVINANPRAREFLDAGVARILNGQWRFAQTDAHAQLERLAAAQETASAAFNIISPDGEEHAVLAVRIATQRAVVLDGFIEGASILLTIGVKAKAPSIPVDHLAAWFGLTPTEARLAAALADGETVQHFARRRGVSVNAVRFLMKGVLRKTDAPDQARVVSALRALPIVAAFAT
jgi:DNA-binding CsgD family transcriptional regulator/PAS domain-containing protein